MNIVSKVTLAYMKKNKKRTMVTIFGVIISVAMITAVLASIVSFMDMFQQKEISENGGWMAQYESLDADKVKALKARGEFSDVMVMGEVGYSPLESSNNPNKAYIYVQAMDAPAMADQHLTLTSGRLPEKSNEIVINKLLLYDTDMDYEIGDTLELPLGHREVKYDNETVIAGQNYSYDNGGKGETFVYDGRTEAYTIVGIMEQPASEYSWSPGYVSVTFMDVDSWPEEIPMTVRTIFKSVNSDLFDQAEIIGKEIGVDPENIMMHEELLRYYGVTYDTGMNAFMSMFGGLLIVIIMVGSVMLIYNAFAISLSERSRQLGMLSSVGATKSQKRRSVLFEGLTIGCISIPLGILAGIGGMAVTFKLISPLVTRVVAVGARLRCVVTPEMIVGAVLLSVLTILISVWLPARRASNISPIDSIRQSKDVKLTKRQVRTSRLTRLLFGFEGELALKNLKRNKKSYRTTIVSLVVSLALFLSVAGYVTVLQKAYGVTDKTNNYDVYVMCPPEDADAPTLFTTLSEVDKNNVIYKYYETFNFNDTDNKRIENKEYVKMYSGSIDENDDIVPSSVTFVGLTQEGLEQYVQDAGLDPSVLAAFDEAGGENIPVIIMNQCSVVTGSYQWADVTLADVSAGDSFKLDYHSYREMDEVYSQVTGIDIAAVTSVPPMGFSNEGYFGIAMQVFTLEGYVQQLSEKMKDKGYADSPVRPTVYMKSENPEKLTEAVKKVYDNNPGRAMSYYSVWESEQSDRALLTMIQIFCYGFIVLMTLICTANILNTVSTGIELRRREFAMLKSVGMDPKSFNRMLVFESLFYGLKALLYGLPIGLLMIVIENRMISGRFAVGFVLPVPYLVTAVVVLFIVVGVSMAYSFRRIRKENILDGLRTE